jgi:NADH-quinone oxidoreductase subunit G
MAARQLGEAGMVVYIGSFQSAAVDDIAHVQLPLACHTESDGTHVNCEGRAQSWRAAVKPRGDARPGWKILRVLGNYLALDGFEYLTAEAVRETCIDLTGGADAAQVFELRESSGGLERIYSLPPYRCDPLARHAAPLQATSDNPPALALLHPDSLPAAASADDDILTISANGQSIDLPVATSKAVPAGCVVIPLAMPETISLAAAANVEVIR